MIGDGDGDGDGVAVVVPQSCLHRVGHCVVGASGSGMWEGGRTVPSHLTRLTTLLPRDIVAVRV